MTETTTIVDPTTDADRTIDLTITDYDAVDAPCWWWVCCR
jgi:hypothetical protein